MKKKAYINPTSNVVDCVVEGMIANSMNVYNEPIGDQFIQKKGCSPWGNEGSWN